MDVPHDETSFWSTVAPRRAVGGAVVKCSQSDMNGADIMHLLDEKKQALF
jgi:hypothetical protein